MKDTPTGNGMGDLYPAQLINGMGIYEFSSHQSLHSARESLVCGVNMGESDTRLGQRYYSPVPRYSSDEGRFLEKHSCTFYPTPKCRHGA